MTALTRKRNTVSFLVALTLLFAVVFGGLSFTFMDHGAMETCPIGAIAGNGCPSVVDGVIFAFHHIEAFGQLTQATVPSGMAAFVLLVLAGVVLITQSFQKLFERTLDGALHVLKRNFETLLVPPQLLRWLALHNKRGIGSNVFVVDL